ncbi:MAG: hypothetical protein SF070_02095 [Gemmatimonadota bacterium]|nr:hypothetical protein [Gemmatimonadota bacterium]
MQPPRELSRACDMACQQTPFVHANDAGVAGQEDQVFDFGEGA